MKEEGRYWLTASRYSKSIILSFINAKKDEKVR